MNLGNPWIQPWKPFFPLVDMSQFIPLVNTIPVMWQMAFALILLTLLVIYYVFLVIRAYPWHKSPPPPQKPEPPIAQTMKPNRQRS